MRKGLADQLRGNVWVAPLRGRNKTWFVSHFLRIPPSTKMKIYFSLVLIFAILVSIGAEARRIAVVGPRSDKLFETVRAAVQNVYAANIINSTVFTVPEVVSVWLSGTASDRLATAVSAASDPELFLALISTDDASIASVFSNSGVRLHFNIMNNFAPLVWFYARTPARCVRRVWLPLMASASCSQCVPTRKLILISCNF
jgi:hypothetical protein